MAYLSQIRKYAANHKYAIHSVALLLVYTIMIISRSSADKVIPNYVQILMYAAGLCFGIAVSAMLVSWVLWPFFPRSKDFDNNQRDDRYFDYDQEITDWAPVVIFLVVAITITFATL